MEEGITKRIIDGTEFKIMDNRDEIGSRVYQIKSKRKMKNIEINCFYEFKQKQYIDIFGRIGIKEAEVVNKFSIKLNHGKNVGKVYRVEVSMTRKGYNIIMQLNQNNKGYITFYRRNKEFEKLESLIDYLSKEVDNFTQEFLLWNMLHIKRECQFEDMPKHIAEFKTLLKV